MFNQSLSPVGGSLVLSVIVAALPIATVLIALGVLRRPAWQASLAGNSSGGVMGKMISPQNIATGVSVTDLKGQEGHVLARTFKHSIALTLLL